MTNACANARMKFGKKPDGRMASMMLTGSGRREVEAEDGELPPEDASR